MNEETNIDQLVSLLNISHPAYTDKSAAQINQLRGKAMLQLSGKRLPKASLSFIAEELESGHEAYVVATAAVALKNYEPKEPWMASLLTQAFQRMAFDNRQVELQCFDSDRNLRSTTPLNEIIDTLSAFGSTASPVLMQLRNLQSEGLIPIDTMTRLQLSQLIDSIAKHEAEPSLYQCCDMPANMGTNSAVKQVTDLRYARFQDQQGKHLRGRRLFDSNISIVAFFYTRCSNPNKCSLTVTRMGLLQKKLGIEGLNSKVNVYLVSYDSWFDSPAKLKAYALNREFSLNDTNKVLRVLNEDFTFVREHFGLSVNFTGSTINLHSTELYLLGRRGTIIKTYKHLQWNETALLQDISEIVSAPPTLKQRFRALTLNVIQMLRHLSAGLLTIAIAFFPKCPVCWAAYMSMLGISGIHLVPYSPWLKPVLFFFFLINITMIAMRAKKRRFMLPLYVTMLGTAVIAIFQMAMGLKWAVYPGLLLVIAASVINSAPRLFMARAQRHKSSNSYQSA